MLQTKFGWITFFGVIFIGNIFLILEDKLEFIFIAYLLTNIILYLDIISRNQRIKTLKEDILDYQVANKVEEILKNLK